MKPSHILDVEQSKALANPLRQRILELLILEPLTAAQVGKRLGEPRSRMYHHFQTLERVGLITLIETRPKRGTMERYFRAVARGFNADPRLFRLGEAPADLRASSAELIKAMFGRWAQETVDSLASRDYKESDVLTHSRVRADEQTMEDLKRQLREWLERCGQHRESSGDADEDYTLTVVFHRMSGDSASPG